MALLKIMAILTMRTGQVTEEEYEVKQEEAKETLK